MSGIVRPLVARHPEEAHRAATPLELLFDLVFVIAIASAANGLHHAIAEGHIWQGIITFVMAFFAIWWAWMNFTWFASAYDNDDTVYRLLVMTILTGSLVLAAGIEALIESFDLTLAIVGYLIMRAGMICLWLRAARNDTSRRLTAIAYAVGIFAAQIYWVLNYFLQPLALPVAYGLFALGVIIELTVPLIAERMADTPWHRHHIIERYGLLNIIVLGETILAGALALQQGAKGHLEIAFIQTALAALVIVFSMWWLYFAREDHLESHKLGRALVWGYGHFIIFASGAAVGAGFALLVDIVDGHAGTSLLVGNYAVSIPVAVYMLGLWFVRDRFCFTGNARFVLPVFAVLVLASPPLGLGLAATAALSVLCVVARNMLAKGSSGSRPAGRSNA